MIAFLLGTGIFLTWRLRGIQFRKLGYALWLFGPVMEQLYGHVEFAVIYVLCALGGSVLTTLAKLAFARPRPELVARIREGAARRHLAQGS